jgi:formamidopyrimidine-DNA glycosylase
VPELPDVLVYCEAIAERVQGRPLTRIRLGSPFVLRTFAPKAIAFEGKTVTWVERMGKRIVIAFEGDLFAVIHLMIAGRFRWVEAGAKLPGRLGLVGFDFDNGTLILTEAGTKKRASLHLIEGREGVQALHAGGVELDACDDASFFAALTRSLTDPRIFSGIGNAYSDEILWDAQLSPVKLTSRLTEAEASRLLASARGTLERFTTMLRAEAKEKFPEKVTAFRPEMAVHGRYGLPCPRCQEKVQRIVFATNEHNYCPTCQTGGKLLADRGLSRLLKDDWPKSIEEMDEMKAARREPAKSDRG